MTPRLFHRLRNRALSVAIGCVVGGSLGLTAQADLPPGTLVGSASGQILSIDPSTGNRTLISGLARGSGPALSGRPLDLVIEPSGDLVVADFDLRALVRIDVDTGDRSVLASETVGAGGPFRAATVEIDTDGSLIVFNGESDAIERVDPVSGDRTTISSALVGTGPVLSAVQDILRQGRCCGLLDDDGDLLVVDSNLRALVLVATSDGNRTIVSNDLVGLGPEYQTPRSVGVVTPPENYGYLIYTLDSSLDSLLFVRTADGFRSEVSSPSIGAGPVFDLPYSVWPTVDGTGMYVSDVNLQALVLVDLASGDRSVVSDATTGTGPPLGSLWGLVAVPVAERLVWGFESIAPGSLPSTALLFPQLFTGGVSVEAASDFTGGLVAAEGDQFLYLTTGPGNRSEPTGNDTTGNGTNEFDESFLILGIGRGQNDPGRLRFAVDVMTSEGIQPDTVEVARVVTVAGERVGEEPKIQQSMNEPNGPDFVPITAFSGSSIGGPDGSAFSRGNTGHTIYELDVDYPGVGLVFRVRDEGDGIFDTAITIDDIRYVPEPTFATALLLSTFGLLGLDARKRLDGRVE